MAREIYAFPSGELRAEHCAAFGRALAQLWPDDALPAAVVCERGGEPVQTPAALGARAYDDSQAQAVLSYASAAALIANLQELFLNADPELFLCHRDAFGDVVARAGQYAERELQLNGPSGAAAWRQRVQHSALCEHYAPVIVHGPDGRCFAVEHTSERTS